MVVSFIYEILRKTLHNEKTIAYRLVSILIFLALGLASLLMVPILYKMLVISFLGEEQTLNSLACMILLYVVCWASSQVYEQIQEILFTPVVEKSISLIIKSYYLQKLSQTSSESSQNTADDINALTLLSESWNNFIFGIFLHVLPLTIQLIFSSILLYMYCGIRYSLIFLAIFICFLCITSYFTKHFMELQTRSIQEMSNLFQFLSDRLYNIDLVKIFAHKNSEIHTFDSLLQKTALSRLKSRIGLEKIRIYQSLIFTLGIFVILLLSIYDVLFNKNGGEHFILVNAYLMQMILPLSALSFVLADINYGFIGIKRCYEKISPFSVSKVFHSEQSIVPVNCICLEHVDFSYQDSSRVIFDNLCLDLHEGQNALIIGHNGSGKSTLGKIITGLIKANKGIYTVNNQKAFLEDQFYFQPHVSYVSQTSPLLNDTIRQNFYLADQKATSEEIQHVLSLIGLSEFINSLPHGLDTHVGEFGTYFSGGEKQKIAIARALLRNFSLGVFDEVTANLDKDAAFKIARELTHIKPRSIKIFITHTPEFFPDIDLVYELKNGRLNLLNPDAFKIKKEFLS
jgi:ATP-binding cassette subfamily B protein